LKTFAFIQKYPVNILFLDIQMPRLNGLQLLQSLAAPPLVILVTAYEQYALQGFDLQVVDYLLKPFSFDRFFKACSRANDLFRLQQNSKIATTNEAAYFFVNVEYTQVKIVVTDIDYVEGLKDYIKIHLSSTSKPVLTRMTMKAAEEKLKPPDFIRVHKSYLVAAKKISIIKRDVVCIGEHEIPVSEFYKENITYLLNHPKA